MKYAISKAIFLILLTVNCVQGQVQILDFDPPYRIKNLQRFENEQWSVGGFGSLSVRTSLTDQKLSTISKVDLNALFFVNSQTAFVVGNLGEILLTQDRGKSWKKQQSSTKTNLEGVYCTDENNCWAVGDRDGLILHGGVNTEWKEERIVADGEFRDVYFVNKTVGFAVGRNGLVLKTENAGKRWLRITIPVKLEVSQFIDGVPNYEAVIFKNINQGCVAGWDVGQDVVACTLDGGDSWNINYIDAEPVGLIWGKADNIIYIVDRYGKNLQSNDFGKTWFQRK